MQNPGLCENPSSRLFSRNATTGSQIKAFFPVCYNRDPGESEKSHIIPAGICDPGGIPKKFRWDPAHIFTCRPLPSLLI